ncbi:hypothetical protein [Atlantibacter hermannii]|uniref:hypothetical protein n=1 Tax=Atlantibacter hermannii TaxID=565 RepID=UPI0034D6135D
MHTFLSRLGRVLKAAFVPAIVAHHAPESGRVMECFIPTGHRYGIDFGNIDPAWYRKP